ncbi:hypothetical protein BDV59DRAFT_170332 [Aspergillus ambiguus]|uniref:uncharacterized protein n=1 Tax=Aspergillus ambiguus TaxID=176160 RepID=UPI003CCD2F65
MLSCLSSSHLAIYEVPPVGIIPHHHDTWGIFSIPLPSGNEWKRIRSLTITRVRAPSVDPHTTNTQTTSRAPTIGPSTTTQETLSGAPPPFPWRTQSA